MTNDNEARVHDAGDEDEHAWATAATNYLQAYSIMQTAMSDGVNVHGAISGLLAAKDALRSLAASATQVPQGWKLVPVEPTEEMLVHGQEAWLAMWRSKPSIEDCKEAENTYKAMLSASPPAPQAATQGEAVAWQWRTKLDAAEGKDWVNCSREIYERAREYEDCETRALAVINEPAPAPSKEQTP
jgi:hypothetical protein